MFSPHTTIQCASVDIQDDSILENGETFLVALESNDTDIIVTEISSATVVILDNDSEFEIVLHFDHISTQKFAISYPGVNVDLQQDTYTTVEYEGLVSICVIFGINNEIDRTVEVLLTAEPITASGVLKLMIKLHV